MSTIKKRHDLADVMLLVQRNYDLHYCLIKKAVWNAERRKWVYPFTQKGFIQPRVREIFFDLKEERCDTADFTSATKFLSRCLKKLDRGEFDA